MKQWASETGQKQPHVRRAEVELMRARLFPDGAMHWNPSPDGRFRMMPNPVILSASAYTQEQYKEQANAVFAELNHGRIVPDLAVYTIRASAGKSPTYQLNIGVPVQAFEQMKLEEKLKDPATLRAGPANEIG